MMIYGQHLVAIGLFFVCSICESVTEMLFTSEVRMHLRTSFCN